MSNVISAFTAQQAEHLTGLSATQLREWDNEKFFVPSYAYENRRSPYSRVYSFEDIVGLRVLSILRKNHRVSLQHLKKAAEKLVAWSRKPWTDLTIYVLNREVHFKNPQDGKVQGAVSGQLAAPIPILSVVEDIRAKADQLKQRNQSTIGKVDQHRFVSHNDLVVAGTRIPISSIRSFHEAGYTAQQIMQEYPSLTEADINAALSVSERLTSAA